MYNNDELRFTIVPKASFRPEKIVFYNQVIKTVLTPSAPRTTISKETKTELHSWGIGTKRAVQINLHNFELSKKAAQRIKEKVSWLYELARNKTIVSKESKKVFTFKMNFITLTLPATQAHTTAELTEKCLNQFLTESKQKYNLQNYVWRLEFQANGNAHYHIATDTFIEYSDCKLIWNRCLEKLGYISTYQNKMRGMTFEQYRHEYSNNGKTDFNTLRARYSLGCATRWSSPNTVDVRVVNNAKNISFYISKYITKKSEHTLNPIVTAREPQETNLRLWFCSRSLSALDKIEIFMEECNELLDNIMHKITNLKTYIFDYVTICYFSGKSQTNEVKRLLWLFYRQYANSKGYIPSY